MEAYLKWRKEQESRPCHLCSKPRGEAFIDRERYPGMLLCANCAGARSFNFEDCIDWLQRAFGATLDAIDSDGHFNRREYVKKARAILDELKS